MAYTWNNFQKQSAILLSINTLQISHLGTMYQGYTRGKARHLRRVDAAIKLDQTETNSVRLQQLACCIALYSSQLLAQGNVHGLKMRTCSACECSSKLHLGVQGAGGEIEGGGLYSELVVVSQLHVVAMHIRS